MANIINQSRIDKFLGEPNFSHITHAKNPKFVGEIDNSQVLFIITRVDKKSLTLS